MEWFISILISIIIIWCFYSLFEDIDNSYMSYKELPGLLPKACRITVYFIGAGTVVSLLVLLVVGIHWAIYS